MGKLIDLIGKRFGKLVVIERVENTKQNKPKYLCLCDCGNTKEINGNSLVTKSTTTCGCGKTPQLLNKRFGRLIVLKRIYIKNNTKSAWWECLCDCGNYTIQSTSCLVTANTLSCGCLHKEITSKTHNKFFGEITGVYWSKIKRSARKRGIEFNITKEDVWNLYLKQNRKCALTGIDIYYSTKRIPITASVDRIDSNKGYELGNIQIVHKIINWMKRNLSQKEFILWCKKVHNNFPDKILLDFEIDTIEWIP